MAVTLSVGEVVAASGLTDTLSGGEIGIDLGNVTNGSYVPLGTSQTTNDGKQDFYIKHNATVDPITDVKIYLDSITPALTGGNTYGGAKTAGQDKIDLIAMGQASGNNATNGDGLSSGLWVDMDFLVNNTNRFNISTRPNNVKIFGDNGTDGISASSAFLLHQDSMLYFNGATEVDATAPVAGVIGKSNDTAKGNRSKLQFRMFVASSWPDGGIVQWSLGIQFSFTA